MQRLCLKDRGANCLQQHVVAQGLQRAGHEARGHQGVVAEHARRRQHGGKSEGVAERGVGGRVNEVQGGATILEQGQRCVVTVLVADCSHVTWKRHVD